MRAAGDGEQGEAGDAGGSGRRGGGREERGPGGAQPRGRGRRGNLQRWQRRCGRMGAPGGGGGGWGWGVRGGARRWLQGNGGEGLPDARSPLAHPARTVFPLAKSQRLYSSRSDPPNWLLMTP